jgi:hypothetical protein
MTDVANKDDLSKMMLCHPLRGTKSKNELQTGIKLKNEIAEKDG